MSDAIQAGKMSIDDRKLLDLCRNVEIKNGELYDFFGELFRSEVEISRLWFKTAEEERNHAAQLALAAKVPAGITVLVDPWKANNTLKIVTSILDNVRQHPPLLLDALRSAIKLEEHLSSFHLDCVGSFSDESIKQLFHAMMMADDAHVARLRALRDRLIANS